jgi:hypothetical protein
MVLRRWHKNLLVSEVVAAVVVCCAYHEVTEARASGNALARFVRAAWGNTILSPGLWVMGWPEDPQYQAVCLISFALYSLAIFIFLSLIAGLATWVRAQQPGADRARIDAARYLR